MSLIVNMDIIRQGNTCDPAVQELIKYFEENNITEASFDEIVSYWKSIKRRDWALWAYQNKTVFEQLVNYTPSQNENIVDAQNIDELNKLDFVGYVINGVVFNTLEEAQQEKHLKFSKLTEKVESIVVCSLETVHENGDVTWVTVDLDELNVSNNSNIKVFNPITGQYITNNTYQDALSQRNIIINNTIESMFGGQLKILKVMAYKGFAEDKVYFEI